MSERQIEMLWRCTSCGHKNLGRHARCQGCNNAKDGSEQYEMPEDTAAAPSVTDPALLRLATAGANWRCGYCGSDQRALDGRCGNCGAQQAEGQPAEPEPEPRRPAPARAEASPGRRSGCLAVALSLVGMVMLGTCGAVVWMRKTVATWPTFPAPVQARVVASHWWRSVEVERYEVRRHEGFAEQRPAEAFEVQSLGQRQHHTEQVPDGFRTEHFTERVQRGTDREPYTAEVPDGYRTESYTEHVACGQTCTDRPQSCKETCTPNKNGFATCKTTCTGGGQSCTPKYCDQPRTRQIPRTRTETRYREVPHYVDEPRTRQVPKFRTEPRYAEAFAWSVREWVHSRSLEAHGDGPSPAWPADTAPDAGLPERVSRTERFEVELASGAYEHLPSRLTYDPPSAEAFATFVPGSLRWVSVTAGGQATPLESPPLDGGYAYRDPPTR